MSMHIEHNPKSLREMYTLKANFYRSCRVSSLFIPSDLEEALERQRDWHRRGASSVSTGILDTCNRVLSRVVGTLAVASRTINVIERSDTSVGVGVAIEGDVGLAITAVDTSLANREVPETLGVGC